MIVCHTPRAVEKVAAVTEAASLREDNVGEPSSGVALAVDVETGNGDACGMQLADDELTGALQSRRTRGPGPEADDALQVGKRSLAVEGAVRDNTSRVWFGLHVGDDHDGGCQRGQDVEERREPQHSPTLLFNTPFCRAASENPEIQKGQPPS